MPRTPRHDDHRTPDRNPLRGTATGSGSGIPLLAPRFPAPRLSAPRFSAAGFPAALLLTVLALVASSFAVGCGGATTRPEPEQAPPAVWDTHDVFLSRDSPWLGSAEPTVLVVTFTSIACPFCARFDATLRALSARYPEDVRVVFKHLPLPHQRSAAVASAASMAAHAQGGFWPYLHLLFQNQRALLDIDLVELAGQAGLDVERFREDLSERTGEDVIVTDLMLASVLGVRATPTSFINGMEVPGAQSLGHLDAIIQDERHAVRTLVEAGVPLSDALHERIDLNLRARVAELEAAAGPAMQPDPYDVLHVPIDGSPSRGPDAALVTVVVFSEFQCPFCARIAGSFDTLVAEYGDDLRVVFKHTLIPGHDRAEPAARAAIAAANQGQFQAYHDLLMANQRDLTDANLRAWARQLGLDMRRFEDDLTAPETGARLQRDAELGQRLAVRGTPHSFINGVRVRGAIPIEALRGHIDRALATARHTLDTTPPEAGEATPYDTLQRDANRGPARMVQIP